MVSEPRNTAPLFHSYDHGYEFDDGEEGVDISNVPVYGDLSALTHVFDMAMSVTGEERSCVARPGIGFDQC